jgi:hypothetical protein
MTGKKELFLEIMKRRVKTHREVWNRPVRENLLFEGGFRCFRVNVLQLVSLKEMADKSITCIGHFF